MASQENRRSDGNEMTHIASEVDLRLKSTSRGYVGFVDCVIKPSAEKSIEMSVAT